MRLTVLPVVAAFVLITAAQEPPRTWRLDFYMTGGPGIEAYSLDRLVVEPLAWPSPASTNIDRTGTGHYRFEAHDSSGRTIFSRGFDPVFWEWLTTAEAGRARRTFQESLRFPAPEGASEIVLEKRGSEGTYEEVWRVPIDPDDIAIDRSTPPKHEAIEVEHHGDPQAKVDILLLGDGYTAGECQRKFGGDAHRMAEALFAQEPFRSRRSDFNIWGLCPPAAESGISRPSTGIYHRSPVGATYDAFGAERYILTFENRMLRDVASWAPYEFLAILTNTRTYGGGGLYSTFSTAAVDNDWADYVFVHEFAHHFAGLADEYYTSPQVYELPTTIVEPWAPNVTAVTDPARVKWRDLLTPGVPVPTPWPKHEFEESSNAFQARRAKIRAANEPEEVMSDLFREEQAETTALLGRAPHAHDVGLFQGANYDKAAFYRPEIDCIMFSRDKVPFCRVCQRALSAVIERYSRP